MGRTSGELLGSSELMKGREKEKGLLFDVMRFAIHDGPGIRTTVFLKGCPLRCWWCHNPEGISPRKELMYFSYKCIHCRTCEASCPLGAISVGDEGVEINRDLCDGCGLCSDSCPTGAMRLVGREVTVKELLKELERDVIYFDSSDGGVTFSGGEPLFQPTFTFEVAKALREKRIHVALDTSGYASPEVFDRAMRIADLFLYDLKLADELDHLTYTGVSNKLILSNLRKLVKERGGESVILRFPVIPGITDTERNVEGLLEIVSSLRGVREIDLLPYHDVREKYERLGKEYKMPPGLKPSGERIKYIKERFEDLGLLVKVGG